MGRLHTTFGDPWEVGCLCALEGDTAHLFLGESEGRQSSIVRERENIRHALPLGVKHIHWERIDEKTGEKKEKVIDL